MFGIGKKKESIKESIIENYYIEAGRNKLFSKNNWKKFVPWISNYIDIYNLIVADFGCGSDGGITQIVKNSYAYDPYIEKYNSPFWNKKYDLFFTTDVFEHLTSKCIKETFDLINKDSPRYVFINISTRLASKTFSDDTNIHISVKSPTEWEAQILCELKNYKKINSVKNLTDQEFSILLENKFC